MFSELVLLHSENVTCCWLHHLVPKSANIDWPAIVTHTKKQKPKWIIPIVLCPSWPSETRHWQLTKKQTRDLKGCFPKFVRISGHNRHSCGGNELLRLSRVAKEIEVSQLLYRRDVFECWSWAPQSSQKGSRDSPQLQLFQQGFSPLYVRLLSALVILLRHIKSLGCSH